MVDFDQFTSDTVRIAALKLDEAIRCGYIWPSFQPIVELGTEAIVGFEVLARWKDTTHGAFSPTEFIPLAEKSGLIDSLTDNLVRRACSEASRWQGEFILAFNLSPGQFRDSDLFQTIRMIVNSTSFPPTRIHIEITEGLLLENNETVQSNISAFKAAGMGVALDDFGTGFASLTQLHAFPFDKLKIDKSFVTNIVTDSGSRKIVESVIGLGQSLGMAVVAEGVETRQQADMLRLLGCDLGQGWLFGKPLNAAQTASLLDHHLQKPLTGHKTTAPSFQRVHQLEALYHAAPIGLCFLDTTFVHTSVNMRFAKMFALSPEEMIGRTVHSFMPATDAESVTQDLRRVLTGETIIREAYKPPRSDQSFLVVNQRVIDGDGKPIGVSVTSIDVTAHLRVEDVLTQTEDHARWTIDSSPNIPWASDPQGNVYFMGPTPDVTKISVTDRISDWMSRMHPDDHVRVRQEWLDWLPSQMPFETQFRLRLRRDEFQWMVSRAKPHFDSHGCVDKWYGVITEAQIQCNPPVLSLSNAHISDQLSFLVKD